MPGNATIDPNDVKRLLSQGAVDSCIKDADKLSDEEYKAWIDTASNMYEKCSKRNWAK
jgi:hypothetical protein